VKGVLLRYFDCHDCEKPVGGRPYLPLVEELDREVINLFFFNSVVRDHHGSSSGPYPTRTRCNLLSAGSAQRYLCELL